MFNASQINPFVVNNGMMYGGNFVDVLFRHLMEHGWKGLSFIAFINFYMYLSLDRIKDFFKYANDKIAEYVKSVIEKYSVLIKQSINYCSLTIFSKIKNFNTSFSFQKKTKQDHYKKNSKMITVTLNHINKTDLMALGNFIFKKREDFYFTIIIAQIVINIKQKKYIKYQKILRLITI